MNAIIDPEELDKLATCYIEPIKSVLLRSAKTIRHLNEQTKVAPFAEVIEPKPEKNYDGEYVQKNRCAYSDVDFVEVLNGRLRCVMETGERREWEKLDAIYKEWIDNGLWVKRHPDAKYFGKWMRKDNPNTFFSVNQEGVLWGGKLEPLQNYLRNDIDSGCYIPFVEPKQTPLSQETWPLGAWLKMDSEFHQPYAVHEGGINVFNYVNTFTWALLVERNMKFTIDGGKTWHYCTVEGLAEARKDGLK